MILRAFYLSFYKFVEIVLHYFRLPVFAVYIFIEFQGM